MAGSLAPDSHRLHERLLRDRRIQFDFGSLDVPQQHLPKWLLALLGGIGKAFAFALPVLKWVFVIGLAAGLLTVAVLVLRETLGARLPGGRRRGKGPGDLGVTDFAPDRTRARALLEDADALAAADRYDEAARLLLRRSIEEIEGRRPRLVRPALTAREIAGLGEIPAAARACFAAMAAIVERSAFAGRPLGRPDFLDCRATYERFAFPEAWR
jgi:hypothetical protein